MAELPTDRQNCKILETVPLKAGRCIDAYRLAKRSPSDRARAIDYNTGTRHVFMTEE